MKTARLSSTMIKLYDKLPLTRMWSAWTRRGGTGGKRRATRRSAIVVASMLLGVLLASGVALAVPSEMPDAGTPMLNGPARSFAQVGDNLWVGGNFTQVKNPNGQVIANVSNVAVFDLVTGDYKPGIAPSLGAGQSGSKVTDIKVYGNDVVIGGKFTSGSNRKHLAVFDGTNGSLVRWYNASFALESVLAAPELGRVYGGGRSLEAFDASGANGFAKLWTRAPLEVFVPRTHDLTVGYRDLELDPDGQTIWAACACDSVSGNPSKALVKLDIEGNHDTSWQTEAGDQAFGISVAQEGGNLYLGAGGSDFVARYRKAEDGNRNWTRDTSGSAQVVEIMGDELFVGGHFWEIADQAPDQCGFRSSNNAESLDPSPGGVCETRKGLAIFSLEGVLDGGGTPENNDDGWTPTLAGKYNLTWALYPETTAEGPKLHVGGEFLTANGIRHEHYTTFSDGQGPPPGPTCTVTGTAASETLTGTDGDDVICGGDGNDTLRGLEGHDILMGEAGSDKLRGAGGADTLEGGTGTDTADFSDSAAAVDASLFTNTAAGDGLDILEDVESLVGSPSGDTLTGSDENNTITGGTGRDDITGLGGADTLSGTADNDTLNSLDGASNDTVNGGNNTDTCITDTNEGSIANCEN